MVNMMKQSAENEEAALAVWVKQTGLEKTFEQFPEDVTVAFNTVAKLRATNCRKTECHCVSSKSFPMPKTASSSCLL